jgi:Non-classical export protein 1
MGIHPRIVAHWLIIFRSLDMILGIGTGVFAYYLYETHPRTAPPQQERLAELVRWKYAQYQQKRAQELSV